MTYLEQEAKRNGSTEFEIPLIERIWPIIWMLTAVL